ncbi:haloacid dehalogenase [Thiomicrorhabdus immobilis]|uniref:Haloacid dehalogenase n=1 Tax=Thiomicrorhabdus immobilis TaxID=2791037 RepID=A0ABN6CY77_9GAMM|nr:GMP/IMP nucleotidase [Thiomicrorhabdus immobilis]BCN94051.1 haloacid dehalogenase [Thiomicrorhabdus immobilis]
MTQTTSNHLIDWSKIETVLLDMDGTLLDLHFDWHFWMDVIPQAYAEKNQMTIEQAKELIHSKIHSQTGTLNWYCLDYWSETLNLPIAALKRELRHQIKVHPEVMEFLAFLKKHNKTVVMVTNAHRDSLAIKLEMTEIEPYFDKLISAHDFGMPKEDIAIWSEIQKVIAYNPDKTLLIDDNTHALSTAKEYGIKHLLCATFVSPKLDKIDPKGFEHFSRYSEIMPS